MSGYLGLLVFSQGLAAIVRLLVIPIALSCGICRKDGR